jgi:hypothetical protein
MESHTTRTKENHGVELVKNFDFANGETEEQRGKAIA